MCGITGIVSVNEQPINLKQLQQMTDILRHRGPDGEGYLAIKAHSQPALLAGEDTPVELNLPRIEASTCQAHVAFGHRRLSIIDLSAAGHQPMANEDGSLWLVFNGEIYNYIELRAELKAMGYSFKTATDTEVILYAYQAWGEACLDRFNGMWAFAIWDNRRRQLFCARDRLGIKPFYYYFDGQRFVFASEIKAILLTVPETRRVNYPHLAYFLVHASLDYSEQTLFEDIKSLPPAHYITVKAETTSINYRRYWDVNPEVARATYNYEQAEETFLDLLTEAVQLRLRSDVPVGTCLSGGLDSSSIVALASGMLPHSINSFSAIYHHPDYSEEQFVEIASKTSQTQAHFTSPNPQQFFDLLPRIIWHMDEPAAAPGVYSQWFVMALASRYVTVLLDGQGGDELFAGYFSYLPLHLNSLARKSLRTANPYVLKRFIQDSFIILRDSRRYFFPQLTLQQFVGKITSHLTGQRHKASLYLNPEIVRADYKIPENEYNSIPKQDVLNRRLYRDITQTKLPALLHYEDRNSMAFSLEARVPFLDHRFVEFALGLPGETKIRGSTTKYFARQSLNGILPEPIRIRRDKKGYPTPLAIWLRDSLKMQADDVLQRHFQNRNLYNTATVQRMWRNHQEGTADHSGQIFRWLATEMWFQNFIDNLHQ